MRVVVAPRFGDPEVLEVATRPAPSPGPGEVRIAVAAAAVNHADRLAVAGRYPLVDAAPYVPGIEVAGTVEALGPGTTGLSPGDRVAAMCRGGGFAERVVTRAACCLHLPPGLDFDRAATVPVSALSAWHAIQTLGRARLGEVVIVGGAAGGVGQATVTLAVDRGCRVVGLGSTEAKRRRIARLGAVPSSPDAVAETVARVAGGKGADLLVVVDRASWDARRLLADLGRLVLVGRLGRGGAADLDALLFGSQAILGLHLRAIQDRPDLLGPSIADLEGRLARGALPMDVDQAFDLEDAAAALGRLADRTRIGKPVLLP